MRVADGEFRIVKGDIGAGLMNGRVDLHVKRADGGEEIHWRGVVLLDDQAQPIDFWHRAAAFVQWRDHVKKAESSPTEMEKLRAALTGHNEKPVAPRIGVLEFWRDRGGSRTVYVEPEDEVLLCRKHEP